MTRVARSKEPPPPGIAHNRPVAVHTAASAPHMHLVYAPLANPALLQVVRQLLSYPSQPAVLLLHMYAWWEARGDGLDRGLFYHPPEQDLTLFSHVRRRGPPGGGSAAGRAACGCPADALHQACVQQTCLEAGPRLWCTAWPCLHLTSPLSHAPPAAVLRPALAVAASSHVAPAESWLAALQGKLCSTAGACGSLLCQRELWVAVPSGWCTRPMVHCMR